MVMQVLVLAVQNAVEFRFIGVATSGATLFRSIGGSVGVAAFGAIFSNGLRSRLEAAIPAGVELPRSLGPQAIQHLARRAARRLSERLRSFDAYGLSGGGGCRAACVRARVVHEGSAAAQALSRRSITSLARLQVSLRPRTSGESDAVGKMAGRAGGVVRVGFPLSTAARPKRITSREGESSMPRRTTTRSCPQAPNIEASRRASRQARPIAKQQDALQPSDSHLRTAAGLRPRRARGGRSRLRPVSP